MKWLSLLLIALFVTACATPQGMPMTTPHVGYLGATSQNAAYVPAPVPTTTTPAPAADDGPSTGKIIAGLLLLPIALPVLLLVAAAGHRYGGGYRGVTCTSKVYKDTQFRTTCY